MSLEFDLPALGFSERFQQAAQAYPALVPGRVIAQEKELYRVLHASGEQSAAVSGKFRFLAQTPSDYPAVGDFVMIDQNEGGGQAVIHAVLKRKSVFIRKAAGTARQEQVVAANVDTLLICMSLNNDFNPRRLERYLSIAYESGATPVIVLTKADLCKNAAEMREEARAVAAGAEVLLTTSLETGGYEAVAPYLTKGRTAAFIGSSGVGKSTLINRLLGEDRIKTGGLRDDDKGHHTTTHRELMLLPCGGMVIDTPGMRELGMWDAAEGIERSFADIEELARACRFADCTHTREPGCAIRAALERGELPMARWQSYQKLQTENARAQSGESYAALKKKKFMEIAKFNKQNAKKR